ncbi:MAG: hypothetical protein GX661_00700 [Acholeplasmataceae bacterium]|nr:hypothetical protein [Acholeplasmataceae bacterium]
MDTDELTEMAYKTILIASERNDYLKSEIAAMSSEFKDEDSYLVGILEYLKEIKQFPEEFLDEWDLTVKLTEDDFLKDVDFLIKHVDRTIKTPKLKRGKIGI